MHPRGAWSHQHGAGLADEPHAELPALERESRLALEVALGVAQQVPEQALGDSLGAALDSLNVRLMVSADNLSGDGGLRDRRGVLGGGQ